MKKTFFLLTILSAGILFSSCDGYSFGGTDFYNDFKVENKLDTTITVKLVAINNESDDFSVTIPSNSSKTIVFSAVGNGEGYSPYNYKPIVVSYKKVQVTDSLEDGNSIRNLRAYATLKESKYKNKKLNTFVFTIDNTYLSDHQKK